MPGSDLRRCSRGACTPLRPHLEGRFSMGWDGWDGMLVVFDARSRQPIGLEPARQGVTGHGEDRRSAVPEARGGWFGASWVQIRAFSWPTLKPMRPEQVEACAVSLAQDLKAIDRLSFTDDSDSALEEARRIVASDVDLCKATDQKATTYMAVMAALVPLGVILAITTWNNRVSSGQWWVNMLLLGLAVTYLVRAGSWSFRVLAVRAPHYIGVGDLDAAWAQNDPKTALARATLRCGRVNQDRINDKIAYIGMAEAFLRRAFTTFAGVLLFTIAWYCVARLLPAENAAELWLASAPAAREADAEVETLKRDLDRGASATATLDDWCVRHRMALKGAVRSEKTAVRLEPASASLQHILKVKASEMVRLRRVRLRCGRHILSEASLWYVPSRLPAAVDAELQESDIAFGRAVVPLHVYRRSLGGTNFWPRARGTTNEGRRIPDALFTRKALLFLPDGRPLALVHETYRRGVLDFLLSAGNRTDRKE